MKNKKPSAKFKTQIIDDTLDHVDFKPVVMTTRALKAALKLGATVTLTKQHRDGVSRIPVGFSCTGKLGITGYNGVVVASEVDMCDWVKTSAIKRIIKSTKSKVTLETQTSIYELAYVKSGK